MPILAIQGYKSTYTQRAQAVIQAGVRRRHTDPIYFRLFLAIVCSAFAHLAILFLLPSSTKPLQSNRPKIENKIHPEDNVNKETKNKLAQLDNPKIEDNDIGTDKKAQFGSEISALIAKGKQYLEQYKNGKPTRFKYIDFLLPFEYYRQRIEDQTYLMPKENLEELTKISQSDIAKVREIILDKNTSRNEKLKKAVGLVYSKSVYDPNAYLIPSLLIPEGGQNCQARTKYLYSLFQLFEKDLLQDGERFVIALFSNHEELGIFNQKKQTLLLFESLDAGFQKRWTANLYDPVILIEAVVNRSGNNTASSAVSSRSSPALLIKTPNKEGPKAKTQSLGPEPLLSLAPQVSGSPYSRQEIDTVLVREKANPKLRQMRWRRMATDISPSSAVEVEIVSEAEFQKLVKRKKEEMSAFKELFGKEIREDEMDQKLHIDRDPNGNITHVIAGIEKIDIKNFNAFNRMTRLQLLDLRRGRYSNINAQLNLRYLKYLNLSFSQLSDIRPLQNLVNLLQLDLSDTPVSDISHLRNITNLDTLYLLRTRISDISVVSRMTKLRRLGLFHSPVSDINALSQLPDLDLLDIEGTRVTNISPLRNLINLTKLSLSHTGISDISPLQNLTKLSSLIIGDTKVSDIAPLSRLTNLQVLSLNNTPVSDITPLAGLTRLEYLNISGTQVRDISPLFGLPRLKAVSISRNQISAEQIKELEKKGVKVEIRD